MVWIKISSKNLKFFFIFTFTFTLAFSTFHTSLYAISISTLGYSGDLQSIKKISQEISERTSIEVESNIKNASVFSPQILSNFWLWVKDASFLFGRDGKTHPEIIKWLKKGGFLIVQNYRSTKSLNSLTDDFFFLQVKNPPWGPIPPGHELMRSFYLLDSLPSCDSLVWKGFEFDGRLAILAIPFDFVAQLSGERRDECIKHMSSDMLARALVNTIMVALTTDYKKDQIHNALMKRIR